jgi:hypothetical protein
MVGILGIISICGGSFVYYQILKMCTYEKHDDEVENHILENSKKKSFFKKKNKSK